MKSFLRFLIFLTTFGFSANLFAASSSCTEKALDVAYVDADMPDESKFSDQIVACLESNKDFKSGVLDVMCDSDSTLVPEYATYRNYAVRYSLTRKKRDAATTRAQKEFFNSELRSIDDQWIALGRKFELYAPINTIFELVRNECWVENQ